MKLQVLLIVFFLGLSSLLAQNAQRKYVPTQMFWSEMVFAGKIKGKFRYQVDYQYRRSADNGSVVDGNHWFIFKNPFQQVIRPWIHYQMNDNVRFSLSPLGWWGTWYQNEGPPAFKPEFRICPQVTLTNKIGRIQISQRYRYEFRLLGDKDKTNKGGWDSFEGYTHMTNSTTGNTKGRFRYFVRAMIPINKPTIDPKTFYVNAFNEIFLGVGKNTKNINLLDQNRTFVGLGYKFTPDIRFELGYLKQVAFRFNNTTASNIESNNIMQGFLYFDNVSAIFKKKK